MQVAWETFVAYIIAPLFMGMFETAMFFAQFGIAGLAALLVAALVSLAALVAIAIRYA